MEELCPDAWLFNYTNPLTALVRAVHKSSPIRCAGLCHGVLHTRAAIAHDLGLAPAELSLTAAGTQSPGLGARSPARRSRMSTPGSGSWCAVGWPQPPPPSDDPYEGFQEVSARLMELYGFYPSPGDRHVAEFFPFFLRQTGNGLGYGTAVGAWI